MVGNYPGLTARLVEQLETLVPEALDHAVTYWVTVQDVQGTAPSPFAGLQRPVQGHDLGALAYLGRLQNEVLYPLHGDAQALGGDDQIARGYVTAALVIQ